MHARKPYGEFLGYSIFYVTSIIVSFLLKPYKASFSENEPTFVSLLFHYCKKEELTLMDCEEK